MDLSVCAQCGVEIEGEGIRFRGRSFCGDECCEEFEAGVDVDEEPDPAELENEDFTDDDLDEDLGYRDDAEEEFDEGDDDDFAIDPDDF